MRRERLTLEIFHDQVGGAVLLSNVIQGADVRMVQSRYGACFALQALAKVGAACPLRSYQFDRYRAAQPQIPRAVNLSHAARPEQRLNHVGPQPCIGPELSDSCIVGMPGVHNSVPLSSLNDTTVAT